jgi:hypothetical protein
LRDATATNHAVPPEVTADPLRLFDRPRTMERVPRDRAVGEAVTCGHFVPFSAIVSQSWSGPVDAGTLEGSP